MPRNAISWLIESWRPPPLRDLFSNFPWILFRGAWGENQAKLHAMRNQVTKIEFLLYVSEIVAASRTRRERGILIEIGRKKFPVENLRGIFIKNIPFPLEFHWNCKACRKNSFQYHSIEKFFQKSKKQSVRSKQRRNRQSTPPILIGVEIRFGIYSSDESKGPTTRNSLPYCHPVANNTPSKVCPLYY